MGQLLERINEPHALKSCTLDELSQLARELRRYIIDTVSQHVDLGRPRHGGGA